MKMVYTHQNITLVSHFKNLIEAAGIQCEIKNQFLGGAAGELGLNDVWPELWVIEEGDYDQAKKIIMSQANPVESQPWECSQCQQDNPGEFEVCWNCQNHRV